MEYLKMLGRWIGETGEELDGKTIAAEFAQRTRSDGSIKAQYRRILVAGAELNRSSHSADTRIFSELTS